MGAVVDEEIGFIEVADGALPDIAPWTEVGGNPGTITTREDGWKIAKSGPDVTRWMWWRRARDRDKNVDGARPDEVIELGIEAQIVTAMSNNADAYVMFVSDGQRGIAVALLGSTKIAWYDPSQNQVLRTILVMDELPYGGGGVSTSAIWDGFRRRRYVLRKEGGEGFELVVDGRVIDTFGYDVAPLAPGAPTTTGAWDDTVTCAIVAHGWATTPTSGAVVVDQIENGLNMRVAGGWRVDRMIAELPVSVQNRLPDFWRKVARATAGVFEAPLRALAQVQGVYTARRQFDRRDDLENHYTGTGKILLDAEKPAWTTAAVGSSTFDIVRDRIRFTKGGNAGFDPYIEAVGPFTNTNDYGPHEVCARCDVTLRSSSPYNNVTGVWRAGPMWWVEDGTKGIVAMLVGTNIIAGLPTAYAVTFVDSTPLAGSPVQVAAGCTPWPINPFRENRVEVYLFSPDWALLIVNGQVVQKLPYSECFAANYFLNNGFGAIGSWDNDPASTLAAVFDVENPELWRKSADQSRRSLFLQDTIERGFALGGCERNDELEEWARAWMGIHALRGTSANILLELKRLACSAEDVALRVEEVEASWYLDVSYPEITPIYLDADGKLRIITAEFPDSIRNLTPQQVADWLVRYVLPVSTLEFVYHAALAYTMTVDTVPIGGRTRVTISSTRHFAVGDEVEAVASAGAGAVVHTTVEVIVSDTELDVTTIDNMFTGDIFRKVLATS